MKSATVAYCTQHNILVGNEKEQNQERETRMRTRRDRKQKTEVCENKLDHGIMTTTNVLKLH